MKYIGGSKTITDSEYQISNVSKDTKNNQRLHFTKKGALGIITI